MDDVVLNFYPELQKGNTLVHALNGISRKAKSGDESSKIISQTTNTFPFSLDFSKECVSISPTLTNVGETETKSLRLDKVKKNSKRLMSTVREDFKDLSKDVTRMGERIGSTASSTVEKLTSDEVIIDRSRAVAKRVSWFGKKLRSRVKK